MKIYEFDIATQTRRYRDATPEEIATREAEEATAAAQPEPIIVSVDEKFALLEEQIRLLKQQLGLPVDE